MNTKSTRKSQSKSTSTSTLFVGGLSFNIQEKDLYNYFSDFGTVKKVNLLRRKDNGLSKGFAFIFFKDLKGLNRVLKKEDHYILGRKVDCQHAQERPEKKAHSANFNKRRIFVGKLSKDTSDADLIEAFSAFGKVKSAYVIKDSRTERSLNFGYVVFKELRAAENALSAENIIVSGKKIICKSYKSKMEVENARKNTHQ